MDSLFTVCFKMLNEKKKIWMYWIESRAICPYLEKQYKGKGTELIPSKNTKAEGLFEEGASIEASNIWSMPIKFLEKIFSKSKINLFFLSIKDILCCNRMRGGEADMSKVAALRKELSDNLDVYEYILSKQSFIGGEVRHGFMYRIEFISLN